MVERKIYFSFPPECGPSLAYPEGYDPDTWKHEDFTVQVPRVEEKMMDKVNVAQSLLELEAEAWISRNAKDKEIQIVTRNNFWTEWWTALCITVFYTKKQK